MRIEILDSSLTEAPVLTLGLPKGGTTIIHSFLNAYENSVSLCEPFWGIAESASEKSDLSLRDKKLYFEAEGETQTHKLGKIQSTVGKLYEEILERTQDFPLTFIKETYYSYLDGKRDEMYKWLFSNEFSHRLFILREPALVWDKRAYDDWPGEYEDF